MTEPVRWGVLGCASIALRKVLPAMQQAPNCEITAIASRDQARAAGAAAQLGIARHYGSYQELLDDRDIESVYIPLPNNLHAEWTLRAAEAGKHVLCEKPLALERATAAALYDLASAVGCHLVSAPFVHLSPTFEAIHRLVAAGAIGRLHSARGFYGTVGPDWTDWYYRVGPTCDLGIYNLKCLVVLAGPVVEVAAMATTGRPRRTVAGSELEVDDDTVHLLLRHATGTLSSVGSSLAVERYRRVGLELYGCSGTINLVGDDWAPRGHELWQESRRRWEFFEPPDETWSWADGLRDLVHAIRDGRAPRADATIDLHLLDVLHVAREAARNRTAQPVSSTVVGLEPTAEVKVTHRTHDRTRPLEDQ
jgi:predicted dehydrogenase